MTIEYFVPDERKTGGKYVFKTGVIEKISPAGRVLVVGGESIRMNRVVGIEGKMFEGEF